MDAKPALIPAISTFHPQTQETVIEEGNLI